MNKLQERRGERTQCEICKGLSFDVPMLSKFEHGKCNPTLEQMRELCEVLDADVFELYDRKSLDYTRIAKPFKLPSEIKKICIRLKLGLANKVKRQMTKLNLKTQADYIGFAANLIDEHIKKRAACEEATQEEFTSNSLSPTD